MNRSKRITNGVVIAAVAAFVLFGLAPWYVRTHTTKAMAACINNLRLMEGAKEQWALENRITNGTPTLEELRPYMGRGIGGTIPVCPEGGTYSPGRIGESPKCSIGGLGHTLD